MYRDARFRLGWRLSKLAAVANYRSQLHEVLDNLLDAGNQATLACLFRVKGREVIKEILNGPPPDPIADAKSKLKKMGRTAKDLVPLLSLPPGQAQPRSGFDISAPEDRRREVLPQCALLRDTPHRVPRSSKGQIKENSTSRRTARAPGTLAALGRSWRRAEIERLIYIVRRIVPSRSPL
jgi:hypothetical protein